LRRIVLAAALVAAAGCDDKNRVDGARGPCGFGGDLTSCPPDELTPEGACDRLVACAAIPLDSGTMNPGAFDWGRCVDELEQMTAARAQFVIACVAESTCDLLKTQPNPANGSEPFCFSYGDR
jgi:hypothetical protein